MYQVWTESAQESVLGRGRGRDLESPSTSIITEEQEGGSLGTSPWNQVLLRRGMALPACVEDSSEGVTQGEIPCAFSTAMHFLSWGKK